MSRPARRQFVIEALTRFPPRTLPPGHRDRLTKQCLKTLTGHKAEAREGAPARPLPSKRAHPYQRSTPH